MNFLLPHTVILVAAVSLFFLLKKHFNFLFEGSLLPDMDMFIPYYA